MVKGLMVVGAALVAAGMSGAAEIRVDFSKTTGPVKPLHGVGQPPMAGQLSSWNMVHYLKEAGVPYSRLHDVGGWLGGGLYVDIPNVFPDFNADENDPKSYRFQFTDSLIRALEANGVEPYYRLGVTIENWVNYNGNYPALRTQPPADFAKWARICEHVIRHYTEGWADGMKSKITYWEIWNEPDNRKDPKVNPMWGDTFERFCELYAVASTHLKAKFPHLKIGGYGSCGFRVLATPENERNVNQYHRYECIGKFLRFASERKLPLDFFSYHSYMMPGVTVGHVALARKMLDEAGYTKTELSLNEWLPEPEPYLVGTVQQAADVCAMMLGLQGTALDNAMIYDARCEHNPYAPLFNPMTGRPNKAYYALTAFNELYQRREAVSVDLKGPSGLWAVAAGTAANGALVIANARNELEPLKLDTGTARVASCRLTDADYTDTVVALPKALPPHSFVVVLFK